MKYKIEETETKEEKIPSWKADFPIRSDEATHVSRREFAKFLCMLSGGFALGNGLIFFNYFSNPPKHLSQEFFVCEVKDIAVGEMRQFVIENNRDIPYILIRLSQNKWRAFEQKCTHLSCSVRYRSDLNKIECPCHKGYFSADTGVVLQGPPSRSLPQLKVLIHQEKVYVINYISNKSI